MSSEQEQIEKMKAEMLSGVSFTYMSMSMKYFQEAGSRIVDREMQKLRRRGLIDYTRKTSPPRWTATKLGLARI